MLVTGFWLVAHRVASGSKHSMSWMWPTRLGAPARPHAHARAHRVDVTGIDGVQQRGVGAVELDERPGEGPVERLLRARSLDPAPGRDDAAGADGDEVAARRRARVGVVLLRRHEHAPRLRPYADDPSGAQFGEEATEHRPHRSSVRVLEHVRRSEHAVSFLDAFAHDVPFWKKR